MRSASSPRAVSMITGRSPRLRIQRQSSSPSVPGSITSSTTSCGVARLDQRARASSPSPASSVVEAVAPQVADDDVADDRLVVDDEDGRHRAHCRGSSSAPTSRGAARAHSRVDRAERDPAQRVPRRRVDQRQVEVADEEHERDVHQPVVEQDRAREAEAACRARRTRAATPETTKSTVNAAVSAAFSFWPALKRPCGARLRRAASARSSRSKRSSSRAVRAQRRAGRRATTISDERDDPGDRRVRSGRPSRAAGGRRPAQARQVEHEARVASRTKNAVACTQCSARSVREKRRT